MPSSAPDWNELLTTLLDAQVSMTLATCGPVPRRDDGVPTRLDSRPSTGPGLGSGPAPTPRSQAQRPHAAAVFFAHERLEGRLSLIFASDPRSRHGSHLGDGPTACAATIHGHEYLIDERPSPRVDPRQIRGAQLHGIVHRCRAEEATETRTWARDIYLRRFEFARARLDDPKHELFIFRVQEVKLTDNRAGFGRHGRLTFAMTDESVSPKAR